MKVRLYVHLEHVQDEPCWWTESPDVPGFHTLGRTLQEALVRTSLALEDIAEDEGIEGGYEIEYHLVSHEAPSAGVDVETSAVKEWSSGPLTTAAS